jgi:hypothetical protein
MVDEIRSLVNVEELEVNNTSLELITSRGSISVEKIGS